jgi:hypothetical protein
MTLYFLTCSFLFVEVISIFDLVRHFYVNCSIKLSITLCSVWRMDLKVHAFWAMLHGGECSVPNCCHFAAGDGVHPKYVLSFATVVAWTCLSVVFVPTLPALLSFTFSIILPYEILCGQNAVFL